MHEFYRRRDPCASPLWKLMDGHLAEFERVYPQRYEQKYGFWSETKGRLLRSSRWRRMGKLSTSPLMSSWPIFEFPVCPGTDGQAEPLTFRHFPCFNPPLPRRSSAVTAGKERAFAGKNSWVFLCPCLTLLSPLVVSPHDEKKIFISQVGYGYIRNIPAGKRAHYLEDWI